MKERQHHRHPRSQKGFVLIISLCVLVTTLALAHLMAGESVSSEKISGNAHLSTHAQHLGETTAVAVIHESEEIAAAIENIGSPGITPTPISVTIPTSISSATVTASGEMRAQELMPWNNSPNVIKAYLVTVDVDVEVNGVKRKTQTGYFRVGTANTGH